MNTYTPNSDKFIVTESMRFSSSVFTYGIFTNLYEAQAKALELAHFSGYEQDELEDNYHIDTPISHISISNLIELTS